MKYLVLEMSYCNASQVKIEHRYIFLNDAKLSQTDVNALFGENGINDFHAAAFGLPSPAPFSYVWEANGEDHCIVSVQASLSDTKGFDYIDTEEVISSYLPALKAGGLVEFEQQSIRALQAQINQLQKLLPDFHENAEDGLKIQIHLDDDGRVNRVNTNTTSHIDIYITDSRVEGFNENVLPLQGFGAKWFYSLSSNFDPKCIKWSQYLSDLDIDLEYGDSIHLNENSLSIQSENSHKKSLEIIFADEDREIMINIANALNKYIKTL